MNPYTKQGMNYYMGRCLELAEAGAGKTLLNPMVGSVIVHKGMIIGEGYHRKFGENHAEVNAIESVKDKSLLKESTLFVNLEPCSHFGKTPPCSDLIIQMGIPRVVIGTIDTSSKVSGRGMTKMKEAGIEVTTGILEKKCRFFNRRFFTFHEKKRPYVILKWAQSTDHFMDVERTEKMHPGPHWISGPFERTLVHKWRAREMAILVGTRTAENDNPKLNVRNWTGNQPLRIVIDRKLVLKPSLYLFDKSLPTWVFTENEVPSKPDLKFVTLRKELPFWNQIMKKLYDAGISSLIVEGGSFTLSSLISKGWWDEARIFTGKQYFYHGILSPDKPNGELERKKFGKSVWEFIYRLR